MLRTVTSSCAKRGLLAGGVTKAAPEPGRRRLLKAQRHAMRKRLEQLDNKQQRQLHKRLQQLEHQMHRQLTHTACGGVSPMFAEMYALREQVEKPADHDWSMMDSAWLLSSLPPHLRPRLNFSSASQVDIAFTAYQCRLPAPPHVCCPDISACQRCSCSSCKMSISPFKMQLLPTNNLVWQDAISVCLGRPTSHTFSQ